MLTFIVPCYNAGPNISSLWGSLQAQEDPDWSVVFIDDLSTDSTRQELAALVADSRVRVIANAEKKFALRNIVEAARSVGHGVAAIIDGDDQLLDARTVTLVMEAHARTGVVAWTAHRWDINGINVSKPMPERINPYQHPWCSSHLKTFDVGLLRCVSDDNFKDHASRWFERGYDQALMLPLLHVAKHRTFIPDVCYLYRINSCSVTDRDWAEKKQLQTINFIRARGFVAG